jgi:hypothetical protein
VREPEVGLCAGCAHARLQRSAKGSSFWRCARADTDARYLRYPPLPVSRCAGFERSEPVVGLDSEVLD